MNKERELKESLRLLLIECNQHIDESVDCIKLKQAIARAMVLIKE